MADSSCGVRWVRHGMAGTLLACAMLLIALSLPGCKTANPLLEDTTKGLSAFNRVQASKTPVPKEELDACAGVALIKAFNAGVVFGAMGGDGILVKRLETGWSPPLAIGIFQGTFGAQIGAEGVDIVFVFQDAQSLADFVHKGVFFYAGASGTAADATGQAVASGPPVKAYISAGGLYGGATIGGCGITIDKDANAK
ncbi:MAG: lipid-binding SYLF domain-containing protein, partial [Phycisphaerales bacterium]|nr:lipid-binding SYLF domain-containing protein [Phycisphaerales bacterium]